MINKKEYEEEIIGLKQIIEQLEADLARRDMFIMDAYPTIKEFKVREGWTSPGDGTYTYRVEIDVFAEDLTRLIKLFTHKTLRKKKYKEIVENDKIQKEMNKK